jgi:phosphoenolpyruvate phosphomutase
LESATKSGRFRELLCAPGLAFLMEAHNGLSARIVEETGFRGIWASGLSISASLGVRDSNEASWTQVLEILEFMADSTAIPILVDGDTGYGNFNNVRRLVAKLCQRDIAAVCIEDKLFPKTNSFIGKNQPLADIDEFCGRIKAGKDAQTDPDFCVIARVEALISGWGMDEALKRAEAYRAAGADGILIHSKSKSPDEILAFAKEWANRSPVVIVPTMYYATPTDRFRQAGVSMAIWANHNMRASVSAMRDVSRRIFTEENLTGVEDTIASVQEIFDLTGNAELAEAERRYLAPKRSAKAIVLAASRGEALGELTLDKPKCMLDIRGLPLLRRLVSTFNDAGVADITVVRGYKKEAIDLPALNYIDNPEFATTGEIASLDRAAQQIEGDCLISYGDILFRNYILDNLMNAPGDIVLVADASFRSRGERHPKLSDLLVCDRAFSASYLDDQPAQMTQIGEGVLPDKASGEWIGLVKLSARGAKLMREEMKSALGDKAAAGAGLPHLFARLAAKGEAVSVLYISGHWLDVNDVFDLAKARNFT